MTKLFITVMLSLIGTGAVSAMLGWLVGWVNGIRRERKRLGSIMDMNVIRPFSKDIVVIRTKVSVTVEQARRIKEVIREAIEQRFGEGQVGIIFTDEDESVELFTKARMEELGWVDGKEAVKRHNEVSTECDKQVSKRVTYYRAFKKLREEVSNIKRSFPASAPIVEDLDKALLTTKIWTLQDGCMVYIGQITDEGIANAIDCLEKSEKNRDSCRGLAEHFAKYDDLLAERDYRSKSA